MTVISSLFSGISGIVTNGSALSVSGDNIANMSTPGFKSSVPVFESALSQRIGEAEVGLGSRLAGTSSNFTQGALKNTTRNTDLAIQGKGFFVVQDASGEQFYTRAGMFQQNNEDLLVTSAGGYQLQGYAITTNGSQELVAGTLSAINFSTVSSNPEATDEVTFALNLNSDTTTPTAPWDLSSFEDASSSSNFSYSQTIYDSLGNPRSITTYFRKSADNTWDYRTLTAGSNLDPDAVAAGFPSDGTVIIGRGRLTFSDGSDGNPAGSLIGNSDTSAGQGLAALPVDASGVTIPLVAGERPIPAGGAIGTTEGIRWNSGAGSTVNAGNPPIVHDFGIFGEGSSTTQYAATDSTLKSVIQNGRTQGELQSIEIEGDGTIRGNFSNGATRNLFKIPVASFANEDGLSRLGTNLYSESGTSGQPQIGLPGTAGKGTLASFAIEQSNVDLASEFVNIITLQRAFQASSRTVSTAAELLQDLVNLGR
jgi:flagellar hook protein FlgE